MVKRSADLRSGFTLTEILITVAIISMVFLGAISLYTTGLKFLAARQSTDITTSPAVSLEQMVRTAALANTASLTQGSSQINLRVDFTCNGTALGTPQTTADDSWWHYRFIGGANGNLLSLCDNTPGPTVLAGGNPAGTTVMASNIDSTQSTLQLINPSGSGITSTVVAIHLVSSNPAITIDTEVALGASSKR